MEKFQKLSSADLVKVVGGKRKFTWKTYLSGEKAYWKVFFKGLLG